MTPTTGSSVARPECRNRCGACLLAQALVAKLVPTGAIDLDTDDTLLHRTGRKVDGAGSWRDTVRSYGKRTVIAWGLNLLVVTLRIKPPWGGEPIGLPIWVALHRKGGTKLTTMAEEAINTIMTWFPQPSYPLLRRWCLCLHPHANA